MHKRISPQAFFRVMSVVPAIGALLLPTDALAATVHLAGLDYHVNLHSLAVAANSIRFLSLTMIWMLVSRLVMQWYPELPSETFPLNLSWHLTEPLLRLTRPLMPQRDGVDFSIFVWLFVAYGMNTLLIGPTGLLTYLANHAELLDA